MFCFEACSAGWSPCPSDASMVMSRRPALHVTGGSACDETWYQVVVSLLPRLSVQPVAVYPRPGHQNMSFGLPKFDY